jgi:hypothetical protein
MEESGGVPTQLAGVAYPDSDKELLRISSLTRDGIKPQVHGLEAHAVALANGSKALVIHIPRSWRPPHMVAYTGRQDFYMRHSNGKALMDIDAIRAAFTFAGTVSGQVRAYRRERLDRLKSRSDPPWLYGRGNMLLHIIPLDAFEQPTRVDPRLVETERENLRPPGDILGFSSRMNFNGYMTYSAPPESQDGYFSYAQIFRSGTVEAGLSAIASTDDHQVSWINPKQLEEEIFQATACYVAVLRRLDVAPPFAFCLTLLGLKRTSINVGPHRPLPGRVLMENELMEFPELLIEDYGADLKSVLRPAFDMIWQAGGYGGSPNYAEKGGA